MSMILCDGRMGSNDLVERGGSGADGRCRVGDRLHFGLGGNARADQGYRGGDFVVEGSNGGGQGSDGIAECAHGVDHPLSVAEIAEHSVSPETRTMYAPAWFQSNEFIACQVWGSSLMSL